jgi:hypothetical protein
MKARAAIVVIMIALSYLMGWCMVKQPEVWYMDVTVVWCWLIELGLLMLLVVGPDDL